MDNQENNSLPPEPEYAPEIPQPPVEKVKHSPYENAPYIMVHQPQRQAPPPPVSEPAPAEQPAAPQKPRKQKGKIFLLTIALIGALTLMMFTSAALTASHWEDRTALQIQALEAQIDVLREELESQASTGNSVSGTPNITADGSLTPGQVYAMNERSVVLIDTDVATGSGFIFTEDGYVVTNQHVVDGASSIHVVLFDNTSYTAQLVGSDTSNDIAVLKMEGENFQAAKLGSSDDLIVGDQVVAIGNPLGELTSTLTVGYVSAKERDVYSDSGTINMLQTDCAINSGNSGGPLFNMKGEVVGITTAKYSGTSMSGASIEGIGFAIPVDDVTGIIDDLMELGYVNSAYLGVNIYNVDPDTSRMYDIPMGCLVDSVVSGGSADRAGIRAKDVITALGGYEVEGITDLTRALRKFAPGETTTISIYRSGQELVLSVTLDQKPQETQSSSDIPAGMPNSGSYEEWFNFFFGD